MDSAWFQIHAGRSVRSESNSGAWDDVGHAQHRPLGQLVLYGLGRRDPAWGIQYVVAAWN